jgi:hypothetical protein
VRGLLADRTLHAVLLVWALCSLALWIYLYRFSTSLPFCDEWDLSWAASGQEPLSWRFLWSPANEHRAPLTRLEVLLLGRLDGWDLRLTRFVNLSLLALSSLALIRAARSVRGRTSLSDAFLALLVLTPCQYQSLLLYAYAYAMALACFCLAISAVMTGWPMRSLGHLGLYLALVLMVDFSGGPAGNVWAVGLCGVLLRGWLEKKPVAWKLGALVGTAVVLTASLWMLFAIPRIPAHDIFRSNSWETTLQAAQKLIVCWLGGPFLMISYPWAQLVLVLPGCYVLGRILRNLWLLARGTPAAGANWQSWLDLVLLLFAALAVAGMIGYGRANYPDLWDSRYATLLLPIGIVTYLLLVRLRAPRIIPLAMTFVMAVSVGWNWPEAIRMGHMWHDPSAEMARILKRGMEPLSATSLRYASAVGFACNPDRLLDALVLLREANLSVFRKDRQKEPVPGMGLSLVWKAESGTHNDSLRLVGDRRATKDRALEVASTPAEPGKATYEVEVPGSGSYLLCLRLWTPAAGHVLDLQVDDGPAQASSLPTVSGYYPYCFELNLSAGKHCLAVTLFQAGARLDILELVPQARNGWEKRNDG